MGKRASTPPQIQTQVLCRSLRRCCLCFGLNQDLSQKRGQIAHLDHDPTNTRLDNLAYLCLDHHDQYDSRTSQSKGLTLREVKRHRDSLYDLLSRTTPQEQRLGAPMPRGGAPLLSHHRPLDRTNAIGGPGIELSDEDPAATRGGPSVYLRVYFKRSRYFGELIPDDRERWLYVQAGTAAGLNVGVQVRAWNERDVDDFMRVLRDGGEGYDLHGPRPVENHAGDYLYVSVSEDGQDYVMVVATFTATYARVALEAHLSKGAALALARYLEASGFADAP